MHQLCKELNNIIDKISGYNQLNFNINQIYYKRCQMQRMFSKSLYKTALAKAFSKWTSRYNYHK